MTVDAARLPSAASEPAATAAVPAAIAEPAAALRGAARNTAWGGLGGVAGAAGTFLATLLIARALGASDAGLLYAAIAVATIVTGILTLGADTGLVWSLSRDRAHDGGRQVRALLTVGGLPVVLAGVLGGGVVLATAPAIAGLLGGGDLLTTAIRIVALAIAVGPLESVLAQATRGLGDVRPLVLLHRAGVPLMRCAAIALVAWLGTPTVPSLAVAWTAPLGLALAGSALVLRRRVGPPPPGAGAPTRELAGRFWRYAIPRGIAATASLALTWTDVLLVAALSSPREAGIYAAASRFALAGQLAVQALRLGIAPQISVADARGDHDRVGLLYGVTAQWAVLVCWPVSVTLAGFAPVVLGLFGPEFRVGGTALAVILLGVMVAVAAGNVGTVLLMTGNSVGYARLVWAALGVNVVVNLIAIPRLGITGAAIAWAAAMAVENLGGAVLLARRGQVRPDVAGLALTAALTLGMAVVALGLARALAGPGVAGLAVHTGLVVLGTLGVGWLRREALHLPLLFGRAQRRTTQTAPERSGRTG